MIHTISPESLVFAFIPAAAVIAIMAYNALQYKTALYGMARMVLQLVMIGYVLVYIFKAEHSIIILGVLSVMVLAASWIALRTVPQRRLRLYPLALFSILLSGGATLALVTQVVIGPDPWYDPRIVIPLGGMIFANTMNAISLAAERYDDERGRGTAADQAQARALNAALIPITNVLFAVGLVSLPGMMTGQILSGVSPLIAVRYQIMVMAMVYGASGLSVLMFLALLRRCRCA
jgi:putative ABC transport system permease protein